MNTPDTEWEKEIQGALARGYCSKENENKELDGDLIVAMALEVVKVISSRDTYWKERASELKMKMEDMLERGGWSSGQQEQLRELFTNEDNLK